MGRAAFTSLTRCAVVAMRFAEPESDRVHIVTSAVLVVRVLQVVLGEAVPTLAPSYSSERQACLQLLSACRR